MPGPQEARQRAEGRLGPGAPHRALRQHRHRGGHGQPGGRVLGRGPDQGRGLLLRQREPGQRRPLLRGAGGDRHQAADGADLHGVRGPGADGQGGVHARAAMRRLPGRLLPVPRPLHAVHDPQLQHGGLPGPLPLRQRGEEAHRQEDWEGGVPLSRPWWPG